MVVLVLVLVRPVPMAVRMQMARPVGVRMRVLVEHDLQSLAEGVGDAAKGPEAWHMVTALQPRNH
jgi:hypothetical protein